MSSPYLEHTERLSARPTLVLTGAYGSGKTECALALARAWAATQPVTLIDLDFVNPYFRVLDHTAALAREGITVIAPAPERAPIDAPALPAAAHEVLRRPRGRTIADLGGDPAGAVVAAQFAATLAEADVWAVVNFSRPTTADPAQAAALLHAIAAAARLRLTGLVSNTHLGPYTTADDLLGGLAQTRALGARMGLPVTLLCAPPALPLPACGVPVLRFTPMLARPWEI
jgi:hypothetical protein